MFLFLLRWYQLTSAGVRWDALSLYNILLLFPQVIQTLQTVLEGHGLVSGGQWTLELGCWWSPVPCFLGMLTRCPGQPPSLAQWVLPPEIPSCPFNWIWYSSWLPVPYWGPWDCGAAAEQLLHSTTEVLCMAYSGGWSKRLMHSLGKVSACKIFGDPLGWRTLGTAEML